MTDGKVIIIWLNMLAATYVIISFIVLFYEMRLILYFLQRGWIAFVKFNLFLDAHTALEDALYDVVVDGLIFVIVGIVAHLWANISEVEIWILIRGKPLSLLVLALIIE